VQVLVTRGSAETGMKASFILNPSYVLTAPQFRFPAEGPKGCCQPRVAPVSRMAQRVSLAGWCYCTCPGVSRGMGVTLLLRTRAVGSVGELERWLSHRKVLGAITMGIVLAGPCVHSKI
jgi:hypothetical protein